MENFDDWLDYFEIQNVQLWKGVEQKINSYLQMKYFNYRDKQKLKKVFRITVLGFRTGKQYQIVQSFSIFGILPQNLNSHFNWLATNDFCDSALFYETILLSNISSKIK